MTVEIFWFIPCFIFAGMVVLFVQQELKRNPIGG